MYYANIEVSDSYLMSCSVVVFAWKSEENLDKPEDNQCSVLNSNRTSLEHEREPFRLSSVEEMLSE